MRILRLHLLEGRAISEIYEAGRLPTDGVLLVAKDIFREVCDFRGPVADFLRHHAALTGPPVAVLLRWLANCPRKFHRWQDRYGKVNRHNAKILSDHWIELHESYTSAPPSLTSPGVIHWKATTACAELGPIRASSVEGRRIREKMLTNGSSLPFFGSPKY